MDEQLRMLENERIKLQQWAERLKTESEEVNLRQGQFMRIQTKEQAEIWRLAYEHLGKSDQTGEVEEKKVTRLVMFLKKD